MLDRFALAKVFRFGRTFRSHGGYRTVATVALAAVIKEQKENANECLFGFARTPASKGTREAYGCRKGSRKGNTQHGGNPARVKRGRKGGNMFRGLPECNHCKRQSFRSFSALYALRLPGRCAGRRPGEAGKAEAGEILERVTLLTRRLAAKLIRLRMFSHKAKKPVLVQPWVEPGRRNYRMI